jgi:ubiquinone/menaquinone biosynthesis C-methylase UbiE
MSSDPDSVQANITDFWNVVAPHYEGVPGNTVPFGSEAHGRWVDLFSRVLPPPPADVLDVGTGTGFSALLSASLGHSVIGIDLAVGMLEVAREMAAGRGLQVRFQAGDAVAPAFEEATFDVITSRHLLWTLREAQEAISNWRRLLRPGGRVVAFDGFRPRPQPAAEVDPDDVFGRHYSPGVRAAIPFLHVQNEAPLIEVFRNAGFTEVHVEALPRQCAGDGDEEVRPYMVAALRPSDA